MLDCLYPIPSLAVGPEFKWYLGWRNWKSEKEIKKGESNCAKTHKDMEIDFIKFKVLLICI